MNEFINSNTYNQSLAAQISVALMAKKGAEAKGAWFLVGTLAVVKIAAHVIEAHQTKKRMTF